MRWILKWAIDSGTWTLVAEMVEVEGGTRDDRPKLAEAMALCRLHGATLLNILADLQASGCTMLQALADGLNGHGIPAARGGQWSPVQVLCVMVQAGM